MPALSPLQGQSKPPAKPVVVIILMVQYISVMLLDHGYGISDGAKLSALDVIIRITEMMLVMQFNAEWFGVVVFPDYSAMAGTFGLKRTTVFFHADDSKVGIG